MYVSVTSVGQGHPMLLFVHGLHRAYKAAKYEVYM